MKYISFLILITWMTACSTSTVKDKINKAGNVAGEAAGEFLEGASKGVVSAFDVEVSLSDALKNKGLELGKTEVSSGDEGHDNLLIAYVIFNKPFKGTLRAKAFDDKAGEIGRASVETDAKQDDAIYLEFYFDKHTNIDSKNKLTIE